MDTLALSLAFKGERFHGWQTQKNAVTVQQTLTEALEQLTGFPASLHGCGRTDAGVHAAVYVASWRGSCRIPLDNLPPALNARLPRDISVKRAWHAEEDFHARFSCLKKRYTYSFYRGDVPDPFYRDYAVFTPGALDLAAMEEAAIAFVGRHDFAAVRSLGTPLSSTVRTLFECRLEEKGPLLRVHMTGDGFLYNMARTIAGTLLYVGRGKLEPGAIPSLLTGGDRKQAGPCLGAEGLCLTGLWYNGFQLEASWF